jgi:ABC-type lipoprotein release transport system permease subunit
MAALVFGLAAAVALARVLESRLVGVQPFDPAIWTGAAIALVVLVLVASMVPARRAARVNPADTLRAL